MRAKRFKSHPWIPKVLPGAEETLEESGVALVKRRKILGTGRWGQVYLAVCRGEAAVVKFTSLGREAQAVDLVHRLRAEGFWLPGFPQFFMGPIPVGQWQGGVIHAVVREPVGPTQLVEAEKIWARTAPLHRLFELGPLIPPPDTEGRGAKVADYIAAAESLVSSFPDIGQSVRDVMFHADQALAGVLPMNFGFVEDGRTVLFDFELPETGV